MMDYDELAFYAGKYNLKGDEFSDKTILDVLEHLTGLPPDKSYAELLGRLSRTVLYLKLKLKEERHRHLQPEGSQNDVVTGD